jgi:Ca-activated chloride channel family protein
MSFIWPLMLLSLLLVPVLAASYLRLVRRQEQARAELGPLGVLEGGSGARISTRRHIPPGIMLLGLSVLLTGMARPETTVNLPHVEGTVILAFDVSNSMLAEDFEPTRMEAAKAAARAFVENQPPGILIGVVAFSGGGLVVQQPTDDRVAVLATIERLSPEGATSLGEGIFAALTAIAGYAIAIDEISPEGEVESLRLEDYSSAVVVLLTDGENTAPPEPLDIAQLAAEAGVRIYPVGIGSPEGAVLELEGFNVLTQLDETALQQIASLTNGIYYRAADAESLQGIYEEIDLQMTIYGEKLEVTSILAGISLILLMSGGTLSLLWFGRVP